MVDSNATSRVSEQHQVLYLLERVAEPVFFPKGDRRVAFAVPKAEYLAQRYQAEASTLGTRFGADAIQFPIKDITVPDISLPLQLGRRGNFCVFMNSHQKIAGRLIEIFMGMRSYEDFMSACVFCRDRMNPHLFVYALSVALLHRPDTKNVELPLLSEVFPDKFVDGGIFCDAREAVNIQSAGNRTPITIPRDYTGTDADEEHRLAYFREDIGVNLHHWHWHLVYPLDGPIEIVNKDRRGELFYYLHQQLVSRYNFERFCNSLKRVQRFNDFREPIPEGYFSKLNNNVASRVWVGRPSGVVLKNINREAEQLVFDIQDLERWRERIFEAVHKGYVVNEQEERIELSEVRGIDILGNIVESSILSVNRNIYGDMHNLGHVAIALVHDPDGRHNETFGVMGDNTTAMRDPIFYRWHAFVDDIFQEHKRTLPRYSAQQLDFPDVRILSVEILTEEQDRNVFTTFWQQLDLDLSRGFDFVPRGPLFARLTALQHTPFRYRIQVENNTNGQRMGTVRIFLAPKFDERKQPFLFRDQRELFIEMDRFQVTLRNNPALNTIERRSTQSSVTIPFERTFRDLEARPFDSAQRDELNFCGCGWPQHMLIPKGTPQGFPCQLFVMVTNWNEDRVDQSPRQGSCSDAASYCGVRDSLYPDRRSMGFPFDRMPRAGVDTLNQFLTPNMAVQDVTIRFIDQIMPPRAPSASIKPDNAGVPDRGMEP